MKAERSKRNRGNSKPIKKPDQGQTSLSATYRRGDYTGLLLAIGAGDGAGVRRQRVRGDTTSSIGESDDAQCRFATNPH